MNDRWFEAYAALLDAHRKAETEFTPAAVAKATLFLAGDALGRLPSWERRQWYGTISFSVQMSAEEAAKRLDTDVNADSVSGDRVREAMISAGIEIVGVRDCSLCGYPLAYVRRGNDLFYDPGCDCTGCRGLEPRSWQEAADWINMQDDDQARGRAAAGFGLAAP